MLERFAVYKVISGMELFLFRTGVIRRQGISIAGQLTESVESSFLLHQGGYHDLFVCLDDSLHS